MKYGSFLPEISMMFLSSVSTNSYSLRALLITKLIAGGIILVLKWLHSMVSERKCKVPSTNKQVEVIDLIKKGRGEKEC